MITEKEFLDLLKYTKSDINIQDFKNVIDKISERLEEENFKEWKRGVESGKKLVYVALSI